MTASDNQWSNRSCLGLMLSNSAIFSVSHGPASMPSKKLLPPSWLQSHSHSLDRFALVGLLSFRISWKRRIVSSACYVSIMDECIESGEAIRYVLSFFSTSAYLSRCITVRLLSAASRTLPQYVDSSGSSFSSSLINTSNSCSRYSSSAWSRSSIRALSRSKRRSIRSSGNSAVSRLSCSYPFIF